MSQKIHYNQTHNILIQDDDDSTSRTTEYISDKNFISSRLGILFTRFARVIICVFIVLTVILIGTVLIFNLMDNNVEDYECKDQDSRFCNKIIFSDENQIRTYDLVTGHSSFLWEDTNDIVTFDVGEKTIYWSEENVPVIRFLSQDQNISHSKKLRPQAIALDSLTEKFYIVDQYTGTLNVIDMNNKYHGIVMSDLIEPSNIVLDIQEGIMFITQHLQSIIRVNLDGTNATTIAKSQGVSAITLDYKEKKIFWAVTFTTDDYGIICTNYDGKNRTIITELSMPVRSLTFLNDQLFWLSSENWKRNASIWSCNLSHNSCKNHTKFPLFFHKPSAIKTYMPQISPENPIHNPCKPNNGNCSDLCFISPGGGRKCACRVGYKLTKDEQTCEKITTFIMYVEKNYVRAIVPGADGTFRDAIIPSPFTVNFLSYRDVINFDYDPVRDNFYYSDSSSIYMLKVMTDSEAKNLVKAKTFDRINSLSYDRLSNNLHYSYTAGGYSEENSILVLHMTDHPDNVLQKTIHSFDTSRNSNEPARQLTISSSKGLIFYIKWESGKDVHSMSTNGSELKSLYTVPLIATERLLLAVDQVDEKIYYAYTVENKVVLYRANFDFTHVEYINESLPILNVKSMYVYGDYLYMCNTSTIWQFDKRTGRNAVRIVPSNDRVSDKSIFGVKVFGTASSNEVGACETNNGNCEEFCFAKPEKTCSCLDKKELQSDGRCYLPMGA